MPTHRSRHRSTRRRLARWAALSVATLGLLVPTAVTADAKDRDHRPHRGPEVIDLPNGFQPEGITIDQRGPDRGTAYFGSRADGDIYAADLRTGEGQVISQGPGTPSVGLKTDSRGVLYVSGGRAGNARIVDARSGDILASYQLADPATGPTFVNDVVLTERYAWFTDSFRPQLYAVPRVDRGRVAQASDVRTLTLTGWPQGPPGTITANGIAVSPDGRSLLVVQSNSGALYRVNPRTGAATQVDLDGPELTNGDGLLVEGRTLFAVRNQRNEVAVIRLDRVGSAGRQVATLISPETFDIPTTIAAYGKHLWLPNARFTTPATPDTPYTAVRIDRP